MKRALLIAVVLVALAAIPVFAADCEEATAECYNKGASLSSSNFRILDPQHAAFGGTSLASSSNFRLVGAIGDLAIGWSSNSSSLQLKSGFLYWPLIVSPNPLSLTMGTTMATISWTPLRSGLETTAGLINQGYKVCYRTTGAYTCVPVTPSAFSPYAISGLVSGTAYTFKIQAFDFYNNLISESDQISGSTTATPTPTPTPGGGGGGGGGGSLPPQTVALTGLAFPYATVHIMLNGVEIATTPTDANAVFNVNTTIVRPGTTNYGFWGIDRLGRRSVTWAFSVPIGGSGRVRGLIVPPTIVVTRTSVTQGTPVTVQGESVPGATVEVVMNPSGRTVRTIVAANGSYSVDLNTTGLTSSIYDIKARTMLLPADDESTWSQTIQIGVGVPAPAACNHPPDVNRDTRIDLVDFSIMAFWWRRDVGADNANDLNCDLRVDLADFSILAYHWTGR